MATINDIMTREVSVIQLTESLQTAAQRMRDLNVGALPVCDGRRLVGIITDRDIVVRSTADGMRPDATPVHVVMTGEVCWSFEDDPVEKIEDEMARRQIRRMPVVDQDKRLVGMITLGDLATDRAPGAGDALRRISEPSEPDRSGRVLGRASRQGDGDAPWPAYGDGSRAGRGAR